MEEPVEDMEVTNRHLGTISNDTGRWRSVSGKASNAAARLLPRGSWGSISSQPAEAHLQHESNSRTLGARRRPLGLNRIPSI